MFRPRYGRGYGYGRRGGGGNPFFVMMVVQLVMQIAAWPVKPPVTLALAGLQVYIHMQVTPTLSVAAWCLQPSMIWWTLRHMREVLLGRLLFSGLLHADEFHLYYNMASFVMKGYRLESLMGSYAFTTLVAFSLVVSHSLVVIISAGLELANPNTCAVGFSAVIFALKYVLTANSPGNAYMLGIPIPAKYFTWAELVLISLISPHASFLGHLCGIFAGILWVQIHQGGFGLPPLVGQGARMVRVSDGGGFFRPRYTYASGTAGGPTTVHGQYAGGDPSPPQTDPYRRSDTDHDTPPPPRPRPPTQTQTQTQPRPPLSSADEETIDLAVQQQQPQQQSPAISADELRRRRLARFG